MRIKAEKKEGFMKCKILYVLIYNSKKISKMISQERREDKYRHE